MAISNVASVATAAPVITADPSARAVQQNVPEVSAQPVKVAADAVQAVKAPVRDEDVKRAVETVNDVVRARSNLVFTMDEDTQIRVVKVVDMETKQVLRQVPSEEVLAIAKAIDRLQGLLLREDA